jgi:hypothetical protein
MATRELAKEVQHSIANLEHLNQAMHYTVSLWPTYLQLVAELYGIMLMISGLWRVRQP